MADSRQKKCREPENGEQGEQAMPVEEANSRQETADNRPEIADSRRQRADSRQ
jgi:hypothetical protein